MNRSAYLVLLPLLTACNVHSKNPAAGDDNVSIHADESGHIAFNLPIAEGKLKVPASIMHDGNFDIDGVKLMPGSSVTGFNVDPANDSATVDMSFTAPASPDEVTPTVVLLASAEGAYYVGQTLGPNGGDVML